MWDRKFVSFSSLFLPFYYIVSTLLFNMKDGYPYEDEMVIHSKDSKDLEKHIKNNIAHVGLLIADSEPP